MIVFTLHIQDAMIATDCGMKAPIRGDTNLFKIRRQNGKSDKSRTDPGETGL